MGPLSLEVPMDLLVDGTCIVLGSTLLGMAELDSRH